jgi:large subunit ribosomal protein L25
LVKKLKTLKVKGLVEKMPDTIDIAIDALEIGQGVRVSDIKLDGLTLLNASNITVVSVVTTRAAAAAEAAPAAAKGAAAKAAPAKAAPAAKK